MFNSMVAAAKELYKDVSVGKTILINDGTIELKVKEIADKDIVCEVIQGGYLTNRKSINVPDLILNLPSITEKDIADIKYGITAGFDYIAASFVRKPEDVLAIKEVLKQNNGEHIKVISKIENSGFDYFYYKAEFVEYNKELLYNAIEGILGSPVSYYSDFVRVFDNIEVYLLKEDVIIPKLKKVKSN